MVYNDAGYGAEVHHFGPDGHRLDTVRFPDTDLAAIARGFGCVRPPPFATRPTWPRWRRGSTTPRGLFVVDAKVSSARGSWWLEEAFRGH